MASSTQIRFSDDMIGDPNDLDDLIEGTGRDLSDVSGDEEPVQRGSGAEEEEGEEGGERQGSDNDDENQKKDDKADDKPKKMKRKRGQRFNLNPERLKGPRGLTALLKEFENFKFRGKGYEIDDLERVLVRMEHWAHRLYPKLHFEDFIVKVEKLCTKKKEMQVYMNRMRMGLETADQEIIMENEEDVDDPRAVQNEALNEFDKLLDEQISFYEANPRRPVQTPQSPASLPSSPAFAPIKASTLTTEQKEMIARKKQAAMEKRQARLKELEEEQLRQATAASLATEEEEHGLNRADSNEPAPVGVSSDNTDKAAEQRERAARNKQLALERLRARRLAAQGIVQPPPDLNMSSSSDLAVPLSPSGSQASPKAPSGSSPDRLKRTSLRKEPATPANQCHEILPDETSRSPERMDETDDVSSGRGKSSTSTSEMLAETEDVSPNVQREESAAPISLGREKSSTSTSEIMAETENVFPNAQHEESADLTSSGREKSSTSTSEMVAEIEDVSPNVHHEESNVVSDITPSGREESRMDSTSTTGTVGNEESAPESNEVDVFSSEKSKSRVVLSPEKMETDDKVASPKESVSDDTVPEKMDATDDSAVLS